MNNITEETRLKYVSKTFGNYDYERFKTLNEDDALTLNYPCELRFEHLEPMLVNAIKKGYIYIMDKEIGIPMQCSGIIGFREGKLMLFCER